MKIIDQQHTFTVDELKETLKERSSEFDVYLWRCRHGQDEVVFEGYAKCPGGIKYLVWRYERGVSLHTAKADLLEHGYFSPRPYQLAQACDGSVTGRALALTRLRHAHAEEQYRIRTNLRYARDEAEKWTERLANPTPATNFRP